MDRTQYKKTALKYKDLIYSQARYFTNNRQDAEDITQDVFIKLWRHFEELDKTYVKPWLLRVTRNLCIDYCRRQRAVAESELVNIDSPISLDELLADKHQNPERDLIRSDFYDRIHHLIAELPETIRSVIIMRDIHDQTYETIAQATELPLNSVKVYIHRGRKMLLKKLTKYSENEIQPE